MTPSEIAVKLRFLADKTETLATKAAEHDLEFDDVEATVEEVNSALNDIEAGIQEAEDDNSATGVD